ncbi:MAG: BamA/TamA family outer membrane protein [Leptospiraceae bacterium]|nr:BamA/TamA family outer membrane protein [Leptospiraceae bacterium]MCP5510498.1 BamA/TamA family outer membrane protein [Leptospiraceae bacterium]
MKNRFLYISIIFLSSLLFTSLTAQEEETEDSSSGSRLPFKISEKKRISTDELKKKTEGWFPTGIGGPFSDPNNGAGFGGRVFLFNNGKKEDPFFAYTPYRQRFFLNLSNTTKNAQYHWLDFDAPFFLDTQWRVRANAIYDRNPNNLYFGIGEKTLQGLNYQDRNQFGQPYVTEGRFNPYEEANSYRRNPVSPNEIMYTDNKYANSYLTNTYPFLQNQKLTDKKYNRYELEIIQSNISGERSFFDGLVRLVFGTRVSKNTVKTYDGSIHNAKDPYWGNTDLSFANIDVPTVNAKTKLTEDAEAGRITGLNGGYVNLLRVGMVYDTRDYEPDPSRGIFAEVTHERSMRSIGSDYTFNRTFGSLRVFQQLFPSLMPRKKLIFAGRVAMVNTTGNAPYFEYRNMWGTEVGMSGLGGRTTLRGFMQDRFVGPVMGFGNVELRWRFLEIPGFTFNIAPLLDFGRPWDKLGNVNLKDYKYSYGLGLRIIWNQSTVIYLEWARSRESDITTYSKGPFAGSLFYLNFGHIF